MRQLFAFLRLATAFFPSGASVVESGADMNGGYAIVDIFATGRLLNF
jgi:hypothetical protein